MGRGQAASAAAAAPAVKNGRRQVAAEARPASSALTNCSCVCALTCPAAEGCRRGRGWAERPPRGARSRARARCADAAWAALSAHHEVAAIVVTAPEEPEPRSGREALADPLLPHGHVGRSEAAELALAVRFGPVRRVPLRCPEHVCHTRRPRRAQHDAPDGLRRGRGSVGAREGGDGACGGEVREACASRGGS